MASLSPMMQQYFDIKEKHKDKILLFRLGDFYEMFFDDAILVSKELDLTLTGRDCGLSERAPMCGVPYHASESYIAKLIEKGYKVAICDQTEDAALAKGLVKRDVTRVVTPGTVTSDTMLDEDKNNYIAAIWVDAGLQNAHLAFADISTGTAHTAALRGPRTEEEIMEDLSRFSPKEVLFNALFLKLKEAGSFLKQGLGLSGERLEEGAFQYDSCERHLAAEFGGYLNRFKGQLSENNALVALVTYIADTQKKGLLRLSTILPYEHGRYLQMTPATRAHLELTDTLRGKGKRGSLLWVLDRCETSMGKRLLRTYIEQPLTDLKSIELRLDGVEAFFSDGLLREEVRHLLSGVPDMERLLTRVVYGSAMPRDLAALGLAAGRLPVVRRLLAESQNPALQRIYNAIDELADIAADTQAVLSENPPATLKDGGIIRPGFSEEVDELRGLVSGGKGQLAALEAKLREETGIRTLKLGYNKVFGYYIEVSKSYVSEVPDGFIRKQTLVGGERYITEELKEYENRVLGAAQRLDILERELFAALQTRVAKEAPRIQQTAFALATLDVLANLAEVAVANRYRRPQLTKGSAIRIIEGRHPVVEKSSEELFVPNDAYLDTGADQLLLLTGPNMAGKSTYMRQVALIVLLAQMGSFVPAKEAQVGLVDSIFTRIGAQDDLSAGKSTFMVEMTEMADILAMATPKSLVLLDEIGRGTSTFDGMSIARAIAENLVSPERGLRCRTLFATHYHELTDMEQLLPGVKNYHITAKKRGDELIFLRRVVRGPADDSYGIEVAKLAGVPEAVIHRAKEILAGLEAESAGHWKAKQIQFETGLTEASAPEDPDPLLEISQKLAALDVETLTPLEALNLLHQWKKELG